MQAMTVQQAGAEGVCKAIADGMRAADYARRLRAVTAERDALESAVRERDGEISRLRADKRYYMRRGANAYAEVIKGQMDGVENRRMKALRDTVLVLIGMVAGLAVAFGIVWCAGI